MKELARKHADKLRFGAVGFANTALDFVILFLLTSLGLDRIISNYISTTIAFVFSFFANKSFTFKHTGGNIKKQFILFVVITIIGLWVIQPIIIWLVPPMIASLGFSDALNLLVAKLVATVASMIWNYIFYSRIVFKKKEES